MVKLVPKTTSTLLLLAYVAKSARLPFQSVQHRAPAAAASKKCGADDVTAAACNQSPACLWKEDEDSCVIDMAIENDPSRLAAMLSNILNRTQVDRIESQIQDGGLSFNSQASSEQEGSRTAPYMAAFKRNGAIFGGNNMMFNNPFAQQRQQQNGWLNNIFGQQQQPMGFNLFGQQPQMNPLMPQLQGMLGKNPVCPVNVPLCQREACEAGNQLLNQDAYSCAQVKGCCFDMNLFLYQQMFPGVYQNVPTCHRAIKSNLYEWYTSQLVPGAWMPQFSESVAAKLRAFDDEDPDQWGTMEGCPYNKDRSAGLAMQILQRFTRAAQQNPGAAMGQNPMMAGMGMGAGMNQQMMLMMMGGGDSAKSMLQSSMISQMSGNNPMIQLMMLKESGDTLDLMMKIITGLSSSYGWEGITRFECQLYGGCWLAEETDKQKGECLKAFKMEDWVDDGKFIQAVSTIIMYENQKKEDAAADSTDSSTGSDASSSGGALPGNLFRNGMFQNSFGNNMFANQAGNNMFGNQASTGMNMMNMMGGNAMLSGAMGNLDMNNPTHLLAMQQMNNGGGSNNAQPGGLSSVSGMFEQQIRQQQMRQVQAYADNNQDAMCSTVAESKRDSIMQFSGDLTQDLNMCHAKGGCFDATMWDYLSQEAEKAAEAAKSNTRGSPFSTRSSMLINNPMTNLLGGQMQEVCPWNNALDGAMGLKSLADMIKPCCTKVFCYGISSDSAWGPWSTWSMCSSSCSGGMKQRTRNCLRQDGSLDPESRCKGQNTEQQACGNAACPQMLQWSAWSVCSAECGSGQQTRTRQCSHPPMANGASPCGNDMPYESRSCANTGCFSDWGAWGKCDAECGGGQQKRERVCLTPGIPCAGETKAAQLCNTQFCENWGEWEAVGACQNAKGCGMGTQVKQRKCVGGQMGAPGCQGSDRMQSSCQMTACPEWSAWSSYSACEGNSRSRTRSCVGESTELKCEGESYQESGCWSSSGNSWNTWNNNPSFNGNSGYNQYDSWGQWNSWSPCSRFGSQSRSRSCKVMGYCTSGAATETQSCQYQGYQGNNNGGWGFNTMLNTMWGR